MATQEKLIFIMLVISYTCFTGWTFYPILIQCNRRKETLSVTENNCTSALHPKAITRIRGSGGSNMNINVFWEARRVGPV